MEALARQFYDMSERERERERESACVCERVYIYKGTRGRERES